ncbi:LysR substrate-binding domain-containing protein [Mesorhizobium sp. WSM4887]|nr:LysR substrate-binding domain-containing protein [Mesorhizobium sp. WSM4887]
MSFNIVPDAIQQLRTRLPEARTTIAVRSSTEIVSSVASRLTDVGLVDAGVSFLDAKCVATFERNSVCVMDQKHPLAESERVRLEDFSRYPFVSLGELYFRRSRDGARLLEVTAANTVADIFQSFLALRWSGAAPRWLWSIRSLQASIPSSDWHSGQSSSTFRFASRSSSMIGRRRGRRPARSSRR